MKKAFLILFALMLMIQNGYCENNTIVTVNESGEKATSIRYGNKAKIVTLENGEKVKLLSMGPFHFKNGDPPALVLTYETEIDLSKYSELKSEVDQIWKKFRHDVERTGFTVAAIRAQRSSKGQGARKSQGYGFVFLKKKDGSWKHKK